MFSFLDPAQYLLSFLKMLLRSESAVISEGMIPVTGRAAVSVSGQSIEKRVIHPLVKLHDEGPNSIVVPKNVNSIEILKVSRRVTH